jgi:hypothetical protein
MKKLLVLLLILVVLVSGCVDQLAKIGSSDVDNPEGAAEAGQTLGEGLGDMTSDLNDMIDGLE